MKPQTEIKRNYLNHDERKDVIKLYVVFEEINTIIANWLAHQFMDKEEARLMRIAASTLKKSLEMIIKRLSRKTIDQLLRDADSSEVFVLPKKDALKRQQEILDHPTEKQVVVDKEYLLTLADYALNVCSGKCHEDPKQCGMRHAFRILGIEPCAEEITEDECEYKNIMIDVKKIS